MPPTRIYTEQALHAGAEIALSAQAATHVGRVLRMRPRDPLILFNGDGNDYLAELVSIHPGAAQARIAATQAAANESPLTITLAQALARGEKMDLIVQKATELGVARIVPLLTERSEVRLDDSRAAKRVQHWRAVAISACEQCGRARVPEIRAPQALEAWLGTCVPSPAMRLALLPQGDATARALQPIHPEIMLVVGPEGGLGKSDIAALYPAGFTGLRLGPRILRTETAGIAAIAALQALYGDF